MGLCSPSPRARIASLVFSAVTAALLCVLFCLALPPQAIADQPYAELSGKYESNQDPAYADHSSGVYGAYQLSTVNARAYAKDLQKKSSSYSSWGDALMTAYTLDGSECGYYFDAVWRYIAGGASDETGSATSDSKSNAKRISKVKSKMKSLGYSKLKNGSYIATPKEAKALQFQYDYCIDAFYDPAVSYWEQSVSAFDASDYSTALQNVIFSTAIQHGASGSKTVFVNACERNGGFSKIKTEKKLITAIYDERSRTTTSAPSSSSIKIKKSSLSSTYLAYANKYSLLGKYLVYFSRNSANVQVSVYVRLHVNEKADAVSMIGSSSSCSHSKTTGGKVVARYAATDKNHKEKISAVKCASCGKTLKSSRVRTKANTFKRSGKSYKTSFGRSYTPHGKGRYKVKASTLNVRAKATVKSSVRTTVKKGEKVKVLSSKMGKDGYWWGKVKLGKRKGWVRMEYLSTLGTASAHVWSKGKCSSCGVTKKSLKRMEKVRSAVGSKGSRTCTLLEKAKGYENAYKVRSEAERSLSKGSEVTVVKVVKNVNNDWWAKTSRGDYILLEKLK